MTLNLSYKGTSGVKNSIFEKITAGMPDASKRNAEGGLFMTTFPNSGSSFLGDQHAARSLRFSMLKIFP
jgi:hypothetical protein